jgi:hypothetical protein
MAMSAGSYFLDSSGVLPPVISCLRTNPTRTTITRAVEFLRAEAKCVQSFSSLPKDHIRRKSLMQGESLLNQALLPGNVGQFKKIVDDAVNVLAKAYDLSDAQYHAAQRAEGDKPAPPRTQPVPRATPTASSTSGGNPKPIRKLSTRRQSLTEVYQWSLTQVSRIA